MMTGCVQITGGGALPKASLPYTPGVNAPCNVALAQGDKPGQRSDLAFDFKDSFLEVQRKSHQVDGWVTGFKRQALPVRPAIRQPWL